MILPGNYAQAMAWTDAPIWIEAMKTEMIQHQETGTWTLVDLPPDQAAIGCRWVYVVKTHPDGTFHKAKALVVVQGFTQRPGMNYFDVTSPVVRFDSLQLLLAIANALDWEIEMMDVKGTFLNSDLQEEIYMRQPDGFDDGSGCVLKLKQALYGLKQAGRAWHQCLHDALLKLDYIQCSADECVYIRINNPRIEVISVYIDDLGLFANTIEGMIQVKQELKKQFTMTDLGELKKILGIRVERDQAKGTLKSSRPLQHHTRPIPHARCQFGINSTQ